VIHRSREVWAHSPTLVREHARMRPKRGAIS
jgi:hypothetical protein